MGRQRKRGSRKNKAPVQPSQLGVLVAELLEWMRIRGYSERTVHNHEMGLRHFLAWCQERGLSRPTEFSRPVLERYQGWLHHYRQKNGRPLSFRSQYARLVPVRRYFQWLARQNHILYNPAAELEMPRPEKRLPGQVLSLSEVERVLSQPDTGKLLGLRDRAVLETLYSTGIRRMELIGLSVYDLDMERETVFIRQGKGKKDRMLPIGERALAWIGKYLREARPELVVLSEDKTLFLTRGGEPFTPSRLTQLVRSYLSAAGIEKPGSCHLFRHTMATLMLEGGADLRFIQEMLGHESVASTQVYTRVSIQALKQIHSQTHPGASLKRQDAAGEASTEVSRVKLPSRDPAELFSSLDAEAAEDAGHEPN